MQGQGEPVLCYWQCRMGCSSRYEAIARRNQFTDFVVIDRRRVDFERDPASVSDEGGFIKARIFQEEILSFHANFDAKREFAFVFFEDGEDSFFDEEGGMSVADFFAGPGEGRADRSHLLFEDLRVGTKVLHPSAARGGLRRDRRVRPEEPNRR
jgi:hypothetical protein